MWHILQWWSLTHLQLGKEDPKKSKLQDTSLEFCWHQHFFTGNQQLFCIKKYRYCILIQFLILLTLFEFLNVLWNMVAILIMQAKLATLGLLKIKVFWNKRYDVITSLHGVTSKILSRDSNCIVDVVLWPKFGNYSISMREVIITSIL